jgi:hypothetical protein
LEPLAIALDKEKWSLVQLLMSSSYSGFGTSSLKQVRVISYNFILPCNIVSLWEKTKNFSIPQYTKQYIFVSSDEGCTRNRPANKPPHQQREF